MTRKCYEAIEHYMLTTMDDSAHDAEHVYRVLYNALEIAKTEPGTDMDILICACLLHDIGRPDQVADPRVCHAEVGSEKAYRFLRVSSQHTVRDGTQAVPYEGGTGNTVGAGLCAGPWHWQKTMPSVRHRESQIFVLTMH